MSKVANDVNSFHRSTCNGDQTEVGVVTLEVWLLKFVQQLGDLVGA